MKDVIGERRAKILIDNCPLLPSELLHNAQNLIFLGEKLRAVRALKSPNRTGMRNTRMRLALDMVEMLHMGGT